MKAQFRVTGSQVGNEDRYVQRIYFDFGTSFWGDRRAKFGLLSPTVCKESLASVEEAKVKMISIGVGGVEHLLELGAGDLEEFSLFPRYVCASIRMGLL